jgi:hypothetical protein
LLWLLLNFVSEIIKEMKTIKNKTAFITGASSGIGEAFAYELAK